jgi:hypothetical protein
VTGGGCCGIADCAILKIEPGMLEGEADGYRLRLTLERDRARAPLPALADARRLLRSFDWTPDSELPLQAAANGDSYFVVAPSDHVRRFGKASPRFSRSVVPL